MKILYSLTLFIFFFTTTAHAWITPVMIGGGVEATGGSCDTLKDSETGTSTGNAEVGRFGTNLWQASKFTAGSSYTVCGLTVQLTENGDLSGSGNTITACIYSHDAGEDDPSTVVGSCSDAINMSTIDDGGVETEYTFSNVSAAITNTATYWVVLYSSGIDNTNYPTWQLTNAATVERTMKDGDGTGTWAVQSANESGKYKLYE